MAIFTNLFHVGTVLAKVVVEATSLADGDVVVGPPRDAPTSATDHVRISLLYTNEQAHHRNDPPERLLTGADEEAPLTLSASYLVTTYGNTTTEQAERAHELLGEILRGVHRRSTLQLPLSVGSVGQGKLDLTLVPTSLELTEKLFSPNQVRHRPFALVEVGPIEMRDEPRERQARPVVLPGGTLINQNPPSGGLVSHGDAGPTPVQRPVLSRVLPAVVSLGGRLRVEGLWAQDPSAVFVGAVRVPVTTATGKASFTFALPTGVGGVPAGMQPVSVVSGASISDRVRILVAAATDPAIEAPAAGEQSKGADLTLTGSNLGSADQVVAWPDEGLGSPADVVTLPVDAATRTASSITVVAASLTPLVAGIDYRFAIRTSVNVYTASVVLGVVP